MVRESEMRQIEEATDKTTAQPALSTARNALEGNSLSPHQSDVDARHRRISEAAYRIAEARGFASGSELDDWLAAERDVGATDQDRLTYRSKPAPGSSSETSDSTTPGRPKETASRQQTRPDQNSQTGSAELNEAASRRRDASAAVPERPADAK